MQGKKMNTIEINGKDIVINGKPCQIRSGAMHYFRIHPDYWIDRLTKLKQCGLNTVETYVAWNFHEEVEGEIDFSGWRDLRSFIKGAEQLELMVIIRPGPFICSEWDFGGLPAWLLNKEGMRIRCMEKMYLKYADRWMKEVFAQLDGLFWVDGGPIIMMQVENEYGCAGNDTEYIRHMYDLYIEHDITIPLFISDWSDAYVFANGSIEETLLTANCRNNPGQYLDVIQDLRPDVPEFIMELWTGVSHKWTQKAWLTHDPNDAAQGIEKLMKRNASFNIYMFHGGTNFGFSPGALNENGEFLPYVNSYDVDAPLDESGNITEKYRMIRDVIKKYISDDCSEDIIQQPTKSFGKIELEESVGLFESLENISSKIDSITPEPMEKYGQSRGFILYRTTPQNIPNDRLYTLTLENLADRSQIFVNGIPYGTIYRNDNIQTMEIPAGTIDILVENMGHVNAATGTQSSFEKGITGAVLNSQRLYHWEVYNLALEDLLTLTFAKNTDTNKPAFYRGLFYVDKTADTWLRVPFGVKGCIWLNGFNLGRYWQQGPQYSLYVPAPLLKCGKNELIVFEQHGLREKYIESIDHPDTAPRIALAL